MKKSMIDVAYDLISKKKKPATFLKVWEEVSQMVGLTPAQEEENIAQFYTDLSLDDRFVHVGDNKWDLRSRHTYNEVVVDTSSIIIEENDDAEEEEIFEEELKKDKEEEDF